VEDTEDSTAKREEMIQIFTSWNLISRFLRRIDVLRRAA
jgi:hypothetical protein